MRFDVIMETSKIDSILEKLKVRNFPSKKWKDGVRIDIPIIDVRKGTDIDRDVILERMNRLPARGVVITETISDKGLSASSLLTSQMALPPSKFEPTLPEIPKTKKISTIQISETGLEKEPGETGLEKEPSETGLEKEPGEPGEPGEPVPAKKITIRIKKPAVTKKMTPGQVTAPPEIIKMRTSPYYLNNRKLFLQKINQLFEPYMKELANMSEEITCGKLKAMGAKGEQFELLMHQRVVRDYINLLSPYRGLLLYHGLGSGKSCSSIAIAEGMKSNRKVYVMTPASLKMNFFTELKRCGDPLYKKNQHWQFVSTVGQPDLQQSLAKTFSLSPDFITKKKGVWTTGSSGDLRPNFSELTEDEQHGVDDQLNQMIRAKYTDIHYNAPNLRNILVELSQNYTKNPFDDTVVIIDEAHNLVNRIVNKVSKMPKRSSTRVNEKTPTSILLYEFLMNATNARVVLLSGTPIINTPSEIGVLFNILRGYIKTWTFPIHVNTTQKVTTETIRAMMERENLKTMDFMEYSQNRLTVTRNPYGFINNKTGTCEPSKKTNTRKLVAGGSTPGLKTRKKKVKLLEKHDTELPETPEGFVDETQNINDPVPENSRFLIDTDCTNTKSDKYEPPFLGGAIGDDSADPQYRGVCLDETGNMNDRVFVSKIRDILTKNGLEVTIVPRVELHKCLPDQTDAFVQLFVDTDTGDIKNSDMFVRRILGLTSYFKSAQEGLLPSFVKTEEGEIYHIVRTDMSDYQFEEYASIRKEEYEKEKTQQKMKKKRGTPAPGGEGAELFKDFTSTYRIYSRACCNFAWPNPPGRPIQPLSKKEQVVDEPAEQEGVVEGGAGEDINDMGEEQNTDDSEETVDDMDYVTAMQVLNDPKYLSIGNLSMYSSKFTAILERILDDKNQGLHLLYSSFRTLEGIGILKLMLLNNGFAEFKLKKTSDGDWDIDETAVGADAGKPTFILYTGTESAEEKEILRNVYNGAWDVIPPIIAKKLEERDRDGKKNIMGEVIKVMMITASGAEGINLKNTRFVHIVEPYWNMVRVDQVVGRARRICSHEELPEEMRTVEVFVYLSVFSDKQKTDRNYIDLMNRDVSRFDESIPVTTDETLYEISLQKSRISQKILTVVKQSSVDCALYNPPGSKSKSDENLVCYGADMGILKDTDNEFLSYPTIDQDSQVQTKTVVKRTTVTYRDITMKGEKYHLNEATQEIYDHATFMQGKKSGETMVPMGRLVKEGTKYKIVPI